MARLTPARGHARGPDDDDVVPIGDPDDGDYGDDDIDEDDDDDDDEDPLIVGRTA